MLSRAGAALVGGDTQRLRDGGQLDSRQRWGQHLATHGGARWHPAEQREDTWQEVGKKGVGSRALGEGRVVGAVHTPSLVLKLEQLGRGEGPEVAGQECVCGIGGQTGG